MRRLLLRPLWILLALMFLFEAWLWDHLRPIVAWIVDRIPWREFKAHAAAWIVHLPPYPTLLIFLIPVVLLFPIKLLGFWMLAHGHWFGAMAVLGLAKVVSMGVTAFIFDLTRPKLLELAWFRWTYGHVLAGIAWAHALVDPVKAEIRAFMRQNFWRLRIRMRRLRWLLKPRRAGRFARRLIRIRRRMHAAPS